MQLEKSSISGYDEMRMNTRPSRADVAKLAGVSESTVSRALNDSPLISHPIKEKVRRAAKELGYIRSRQATLFASKRTNMIGFVVPSYESFPPFSRSYFPALLDGVVLETDAAGYSATIILDRKSVDTEDYYTLIRSKTVDGLLFAVTRADFRPFYGLREQGVPFVLINNYHEGLNSVDALPESGMRKAFAHSIRLGHRHFGYITGDMQFRNATDRLEVFNRLASEFDVKTTITEGDFSKTSGYLGASRLLGGKGDTPTLIMTSSDRCAFGVLAYAAEKGLRVPQDLNVIGYDNLPPVTDVSPTLSTIDHPVTALARHAARLLISILEGKRQEPVQEWLQTDFIVRNSTSAAEKAWKVADAEKG
jgi:LacI family transcriptional regulator